MKKSVLLTSLGGYQAYHFYQDFKQRGDYRVYFSDALANPPAKAVSSDVLRLLPGKDSGYVDDLIAQATKLDIRMIVPGSDEEAFAIMKAKAKFDQLGIITAVPPVAFYDHFQSKSAMYDYLVSRHVPVPTYRCIKTIAEFEQALDVMKYPAKPLLMKPNSSRGGRGIVVLSETVFEERDGLTLYNQALAKQLINGQTEFMIMPYIKGTIFDIDVLSFADGQLFLGSRQRVLNIAKPFYGNIFQHHPALEALAKQVYRALSNQYMIDYDIILTPDSQAQLLEVNPRPSGSTISYLPFGYNLYHMLIKSYLDQQSSVLPNMANGTTVHAFYQMIAAKN